MHIINNNIDDWIKDDGVVLLSKYIKYLPNLQQINLARNKIKDEGMICLCSQFCYCTSLTKIIVKSIYIIN